MYSIEKKEKSPQTGVGFLLKIILLTPAHSLVSKKLRLLTVGRTVPVFHLKRKEINTKRFWLPCLNCRTSYQENPCIACFYHPSVFFFIKTACGIVFFTKQLVGVSLEKKRNHYEQFLAPFFELSDW